jgi:hypothetical protein
MCVSSGHKRTIPNIEVFIILQLGVTGLITVSTLSEVDCCEFFVAGRCCCFDCFTQTFGNVTMYSGEPMQSNNSVLVMLNTSSSLVLLIIHNTSCYST